LDLALGGDGTNKTYTPQYVTDNYINRLGGAFAGYCGSDGTLLNQGSWALYWSATEYGATSARGLSFGTNGSIYPQNWYYKYVGLTLRCVRN